MTIQRISRALLGAGSLALLLGACGGGGGGVDGPIGIAPPTDPLVAGTDVPASAVASSPAAFSFASLVAATASDTTEPLTLGDVTLASSDTDEPDDSI